MRDRSLAQPGGLFRREDEEEVAVVERKRLHLLGDAQDLSWKQPSLALVATAGDKTPGNTIDTEERVRASSLRQE